MEEGEEEKDEGMMEEEGKGMKGVEEGGGGRGGKG